MKYIKKALHLNIADFIIRIIFIKKTKHLNFLSYLKKRIIKKYSAFIIKNENYINKNYDFLIKIEEKNEIGFFKKKGLYFFNLFYLYNKSTIITFSTISIYQFEMIIKYIISRFINKNKLFIVHCSAILKNDGIIIFLGKSGAGKSTIVKILKKKFVPIVDDVGLIRKKGNNYYFYQTPYTEKNKYPIHQKKWRIKKIFFIKKTKSKQKSVVNKLQILKKDRKLINYLKNQIITSRDKKNLINFLIKYANDFYFLHLSLKDKNNIYNLISDLK